MDGAPPPPDALFAPADDPRAFRHALGAFATGVTIVTAAGPEGPVGMTANSFAAVSLDPPLVLWCPALASRRFPLFATAQDFAIHVLADGQRAVADGFTRHPQAFDTLDWAPDTQGVPLIHGVAARFRCRLHALHLAGDHAIIIGRVLSALRSDRPGLLFHAGRYGAIGDPR